MNPLDFIINGQGHGSVANRLLAADFNPGVLRPYIGKDGRSYTTAFQANAAGEVEAKAVLTNAPATLRYEDWRLLDTQVLKAARQRLRLVADLRGDGLQYVIPNGMAKTVFSTENMTDPGTAALSMDGKRRTVGDRPEFNMVNLPLPIAHSDFTLSARQVLVSRNGGTPLDTALAEAASRRVAEIIEQLAIGSLATYTFGGGSIYGLINFPSRITKTMTAPTLTAWVPKTTLTEVLSMKQKSVDAKHYGPWVLYTSTNWDQYLDADYILTGGNVATQTLRERIAKIDGIQAIRPLDYLTGFQMVLLQQSTDVVREVVGMDFTTVQWESEGGLEINFKVMAIMVPQVRADAYGTTGIVHGATA